MTGFSKKWENHWAAFVEREQVCAEILAEARRYSAWLVILGTLGRTTAGRWPLLLRPVC